MTSNEIKEAMMSEAAVVCNGIEYKRIVEYVLRYTNGTFVKSCGLLDKNGKSICYVTADSVHLK